MAVAMSSASPPLPFSRRFIFLAYRLISGHLRLHPGRAVLPFRASGFSTFIGSLRIATARESFSPGKNYRKMPFSLHTVSQRRKGRALCVSSSAERVFFTEREEARPP